MTTQTATELGPCPRCGDPLTEQDVMIEYETADGEQGRWTDCSGCGDVVDPD